MERNFIINSFVKKGLKPVLLISTIFCLLFSVLSPLFNNGSDLRIAAAVGLSLFVVFHGVHRYGLQKMLVLITITFIITWAFETISITTGFPFGRFYYTELLGVKAGEVPWGIMLAYFFIGYLAWTMGGLFLNETGESINKDNLIRVPLISAGLMVLWNMSFDPVLSTIEGNWVWINGGFHGGVPITNYFGWFLTTYIFFQLFALFLYVFKKQEHESKESWYWYLVPVLFIAQSIEYIIHPFIRTNNEPIYLASFFITLFGVVSASLLCLLVIKKRIHNL